MLGLASTSLLVLVAVATVASPVIGVVWWQRSVHARRSWIAWDLGRWGFVLLGQLLAVLLTFLIVNDTFAFYTSWTDLFGPGSAETSSIRSQGR